MHAQETTTRLKYTISVLILFLPILAIVWRWECRSIFYPGWDLLGAANGLFLLSTSSFLDAVKEVFWMSRHFHYWNQTDSVIFSLIPGGLSRLYPFEFWAHLTSFLVFVISLAVIARVTDLGKKELPVLALLVASSPALLSFSITGYPYISGFLTHGLALLLVLRKQRSLHPVLLVLAGLAIIELSWHVYELGKTVFIVFFSAALFLSSQPIRDRILYALLGVVSFGLVLANRQTNVDLMLNPENGFGNIFGSIMAALHTIFIEASLDIPVLAVLGLVALLFIRKNRFFLMACLLAQWGLILILSLRGMHELRPRRFLVVDMYSIAVILFALLPILRDMASQRYSKLVVGAGGLALLAGVAWQFSDLADFCSVDARDRIRALPHTESSADYYISPERIIAADEIAKLVLAGKHILLLYNFNAYSENTTDPAGLPERVYLKLGHNKFSDQVHIFSDRPSRYSRVPIHPMSELTQWLDSLNSSMRDNVELAQQYVVLKYTIHHEQRFKDEQDLTWSELDKRFELTRLQEPLRPIMDTPLIPLFEIYAISTRGP